jgi:hypothetical protein
MNQIIGDNYTLISRESNYQEFCRAFKTYFDKDHVADLDENADYNTRECYAFVANGKIFQPLYRKQSNYIMSDNGRTFDNLTYK